MSDLNTEIKIGADASGVEAGVGKAKRSLKDLGDAAQKAGKDAGAGIGSIGAGGDKAAKDVERATKNMQGSLQRLLAEQKAGAKGSREYYEALADTRGISRNAIKPILDQIDAAKSKTLQAKTAADSWTASLGKVGPLVAAAFSGAAITGFLGKVVSVQREFDVLNSSLKTVTGSSAAAEREMAWLKDFAKETPFGLAQATQGFVKMKALGLDPTRAALTSFGNTASAMGKDLNQMIEAVADASTGEFERLKEFGIKAKKEGDNVSLTFQGVTTTIGNSAREITKYLEDIGNTSFGGAMEERAKTLDGTIAALGDTWDELFRTVSTNNVGGLIFDSVTLANGVLEDATTLLRAMGGSANDASKDFGALTAVQGGVATFFETVAVLASNTLYVLRQTGDTMAGVAAGYKAFFSFDFDAVRAIGAEMKANGEAARKEIDATTARILNARKAQEEYARYATRNASAATDPRRVDLGGSAPRATGGASAGAARGVKETISEYDKLIKKLSDELPKAAAEAEAAQMGYNKAQTEFLALAGSPAWASFSNSQRAVVASMFEGKIASEEAGEAAKALSKSYAEAAAERIKTIQSMERSAEGLQSQNDALREEIELIGLSTEQQTLVLQQRNDVIILTKEATLAELERQSAITGTQTRVEIALASEIEALKERNALLGAKGVKNAAVDAAKSAADEWQKTSDKINDTLTDALMRGFESGKGFAENLRQTVVNMFKTMVLRPVISAIINPISGAITGAMGLSGAANAGTSALSTVGSIGTGAKLLGGLGTFGGGLSGGFGGLMGSLGLNATGATLGGAISAGTTAIGAGNLMGGLGTLAGALGPIVLGIAAISSLFKRKLKDSGIEGQFGGDTGFEGQSYKFYDGGLFRSDKTEYSALDETLRKTLGDTFDAMQVQVTSFADALGLNADKIGTFTSDIKLSLRGLSEQDAQAKIQEALGTVNDQLAQEILGSWKEVAQEVIRTAWSNAAEMDAGADIQRQYTETVTGREYTASEFARTGEKAIDTLTRLATSLGTVNAIWENLGYTVYEASLAGADAASTMADAFGGLEAMAAATGAYFQNFYSAEEQRAAVARQLNEALGKLNLTLPDIDATDARAQYRALAEAQDRNTESGREAYVTLLQLSGAFASITEAAGRAVDAASLDRKDRLAAQRAQEKQAAEALQKQIEAYADGAEQFNTLRDSLLKAGDAAGLLAAVTERAFADPSGTAPKWGANSSAASFNYEYGLQQAAMRQSLSNELSANALRVQNIGGALGGLSVTGMMGQDDPVVRATYIGLRDAMVQAAGDAGFAVRDAVDGAALYAAQAQVLAQFSATGPGLASVYAARESYGVAASSADVKAYEEAQRKLNGALSSGAIGADQFARALQALNDTLPQAAALSGDFDAQAARAAAALDELAQTGLRSIGYYFGQLNTMALELAKMDEPINATIASIGRLNSFETAFGVSADAAGVTGLSSLQIDRAQIIAEAAGIASAAMTTADAAAAAAQLAQSPAFAELGAKGIRDAALLLDGVGQYNAEGFERAFIRISDALAKGGVNEGQYKALFDTALDMFNGVPEETRTLIDSMQRLRDAMSGFADGLLIDERRTTLNAGATLEEMQRQYAQAFAGSSTGDNDAIGKYQQLANTLLDKELYSTQAEYNAAFGSVYGDARQLESIGINTLANAQGNAMVTELKDMNAKLNKRVEDLEKNLLAALAQIAKNTSDTSRGIEQQIVMAEDTP